MKVNSKGEKQRIAILDHLLIYGTLATVHAREAMGIFHADDRVQEPRKLRWPKGLNWHQGEEMVAGRTPRQGQYYLQVKKLTPEQLEIQQRVRQDNS